MKHTINNTSDTTKQITVSLTADDLAEVKAKTVKRLAKDVKVAGFRQGKTPVGVAEKNINPQVLESEIVEDAVNQHMIAILDAESIMPLDRPKVEVKKMVPGEQLEFVAELEVIPEIKLGDYKNLKAKKDDVKVTEKDVTEVIDRLRGAASEKKDVDRAAKDGDEIVMDFAGTDKDGKEVEGAKGTDYPLTLGSKTFIPGFEEGLIGKKLGDKFDLDLTFPKDYHHKPLAGAKVKFAVTIKAVKEVVLPELTDEFAAKTGAFKTVDELKADIKKELESQKEREATDKLKDSLLEQLIKVSTIPTPEILIKDQMQMLERDFTQNLMYRGLTLDQYLEQQGLTKEDWEKNELREQSIRRVQVGLALAELSKIAKIEVNQQELEARVAELMQGYGNNPEIAKQFESPEVRRDIANNVMTRKTTDYLVEVNAK
ncbi:MAG TPA: trigger factor [Candidatus Saccharimonadales bacterium]|nr:trigger factor [Candidatus Saccharimonadales bacterium]